jgi:superfamily II DNA helicase RecQ
MTPHDLLMAQSDVLVTLKEVFGHEGFRTNEQEAVIRKVISTSNLTKNGCFNSDVALL